MGAAEPERSGRASPATARWRCEDSGAAYANVEAWRPKPRWSQRLKRAPAEDQIHKRALARYTIVECVRIAGPRAKGRNRRAAAATLTKRDADLAQRPHIGGRTSSGDRVGSGPEHAGHCRLYAVYLYATNQPDTDPHWQPRLVLPRGIPHAFTVVESTKIFKSIHPLPNIHSLPRASPRQPMLAITIEHGHLDLALLLFRTRCSGSRCSGVSCGSRFLPLLVWLAAVAELPCCCNIWARFSSHSGEGSAK